MAQPQDGRPVGDDCDQITAIGVFKRRIRVGFDFAAGDGHTGGVGQAEIGLGEKGLGGHDFGFTRLGFTVVAQRLFVK